MKSLFTTFTFLLCIPTFLLAQCDALSVSVSASDTAYVQLYHAGLFLIPNGDVNSCEWEITTLDGALIHQETTSGNFEEQSFILFDHSVPLTDSMQVVLAITNETEGITCTITDTLAWEETEVLPGSFIGNWNVIGNYTGIEDKIVSTNSLDSSLEAIVIYPTPSSDFFQLNGPENNYQFEILDIQGRSIRKYPRVSNFERVDISDLDTGTYLIRFLNEDRLTMASQRIVKQ